MVVPRCLVVTRCMVTRERSATLNTKVSANDWTAHNSMRAEISTLQGLALRCVPRSETVRPVQAICGQ